MLPSQNGRVALARLLSIMPMLRPTGFIRLMLTALLLADIALVLMQM